MSKQELINLKKKHNAWLKTAIKKAQHDLKIKEIYQSKVMDILSTQAEILWDEIAPLLENLKSDL